MGISLDAHLEATLEGLNETLTKLANRMAREQLMVGRYLEPPFGLVATATASQLVLTDLGGPNQGRFWQVNRFMADVALLGGARPANFTLYLFSGPANQQQSFFQSAINIEWAWTTYPALGAWSSRQFLVQYPEHLIVGLQQPATAPTAHQVGGQVALTDIPEHAKLQDVDLLPTEVNF